MYRNIRDLILLTGIVAIVYFCFQIPAWQDRIMLGSIGAFLYTIFVIIIGERIRRLSEGYYTYLRGGGEDGDLVYVEGSKELRLYFKRRPHIVYVPSHRAWVNVMPDWAKNNRDTIMARINGQLGRHWSFEDTENQDRLLNQKSE